MRNRRLIVVALITLLAGCYTTYWQYDNINYPTSSAGINAARNDFNNILSGIEPLPKPIARSVKVVLPNIQRVRDAGVIKTGQPTQEIIDYIATIGYLGNYGMTDALKKRTSWSQTVNHDPSLCPPCTQSQSKGCRYFG